MEITQLDHIQMYKNLFQITCMPESAHYHVKENNKISFSILNVFRNVVENKDVIKIQL